MLSRPISPNSPIRPRLARGNRLQDQQWVSEIGVPGACAGSDRADSGVDTAVIPLRLLTAALMGTGHCSLAMQRIAPLRHSGTLS